MGRMMRHEVIGYGCNRKSCQSRFTTTPVAAGTLWLDQVLELQDMVRLGWALVLTGRLRSYCPHHAQLVRDCTCRTNPDRQHLCVVHDGQAAALTWAQWTVPAAVLAELERVAQLERLHMEPRL